MTSEWKIVSAARWRLRHPLRWLRASIAPRVPWRLRRAAVAAARFGAAAAPVRDPAAWLDELRRVPPARESNLGSPEVSIVVVAYQNDVMTRLCIESIHRFTPVHHEIIVVDNASTDGSVSWLREEERSGRIRLLANRENRGFAAACNQGVDLASAPVLVIMNNDVVVAGGWLDPLLALTADRTIGLAGPVTNACGNEARVEAPYATLAEMLTWVSERRGRTGRVAFEIPMVALFCTALRRDVWNETGGLDERFGIGMFEDDDLSRRVKLAGYRVVCTESAFVHHWQLAAFRLGGESQYRSLFEKNRRTFREKWRSPGAPASR